MSDFDNEKAAFQWRGFMIDVCRHFIPLVELRRLIDGMAYLKLNILHLHLSEDQGWRFESKKWPKLTTLGAWRDETVVGRPGRYGDHDLHPENYKNKYDGVRHGGFYTQQELKDLVTYAKERAITIVPEIDMPGHMRAARAAYPELGYNGQVLKVGTSWGVYPEVLRVDEKGLNFAKDILDELCEVFESDYIHIGGDECPKSEWNGSQTARNQLAQIGGKDMEDLQRWFTEQMAAHLKAKGRKLVGWDEIIDGGLPDGRPVVVAWRDWTNAASRAVHMGAEIVQAPEALYFDHSQGSDKGERVSIGPGADLHEVYALDPYKNIDISKKHLVRGIQAQIWTEYVPDIDHLWYMVFPRLIAVADVAYLGERRPPYEEFLKGLPSRLAVLKEMGIGHRPLHDSLR